MRQVHGTMLGLKSDANQQKEWKRTASTAVMHPYELNREKRIDKNEVPSSEPISKSFIQRQTGHTSTMIRIPVRRSKGKERKKPKQANAKDEKEKAGTTDTRVDNCKKGCKKRKVENDAGSWYYSRLEIQCKQTNEIERKTITSTAAMRPVL